jgi:hypothetical protein
MHFIIIKGTSAEKELQSLKEYAENPENTLKSSSEEDRKKINSILDSGVYTRVLKLSDPAGVEDLYRVCLTIDALDAISQKASDPTEPAVNVPILMRHLSVLRMSAYPDPIATFTLAKFLGFTGSPDDWTITNIPNLPNAVAVVQAMNFDQPHEIILMRYPDKSEKEAFQ